MQIQEIPGLIEDAFSCLDRVKKFLDERTRKNELHEIINNWILCRRGTSVERIEILNITKPNSVFFQEIVNVSTKKEFFELLIRYDLISNPPTSQDGEFLDVLIGFSMKKLGTSGEKMIFERINRNLAITNKSLINLDVQIRDIKHNENNEKIHLDRTLWDQLLQRSKKFGNEFSHFLVIDDGFEDYQNVEALGRLPWLGAIDFNTNIENLGLYPKIELILSRKRQVHIAVDRKNNQVNAQSLSLSISTTWFFARGLASKIESLSTGNWLNWRRQKSSEIQLQVEIWARLVLPNPSHCLILWKNNLNISFLDTILDQIVTAFGDKIEITILSDPSIDLQQVCNKFEVVHLKITPEDFFKGINAHSISEENANNSYNLPMPNGNMVQIEKRLWLEEEIEVLYLETGQKPDENWNIDSYLRGYKASWFDLEMSSDVKRDITDLILRRVKEDLLDRRVNRINLNHFPGSGGSTISRRIVWDLHKEYPCVVLKRSNPIDTIERIYYITSQTNLPVLVLIDSSEISERIVDELVQLLKARQIQAVILQNIRRFNEQKESIRSFWVKSQLSSIEESKFLIKFSQHKPEKESQLTALVENYYEEKSPFIFALYAYENDFVGIKSFVSGSIEMITENQRKLLLSIAIIYHYAQHAIPIQIFSEDFGSKKLRLDLLLNGASLKLIIEEKGEFWRPLHEIIAFEMIVQLLAPKDGLRENWKMGLSDWADFFIQMIEKDANQKSDQVLEIARRLFVYRDNSEIIGTDQVQSKRFSQFIEDIPSVEGGLEILKSLTRAFPDEAHFWAHLARFYSIKLRDFENAATAIRNALQLSPNDSRVHHMNGMTLRNEIENLISNHAKVTEILPLAEKAFESFAKTRNLSPDNEHGYIADAHLMIKLLYYAARDYKNVIEYLMSPGIPMLFQGGLAHIEDLLERVRRDKHDSGGSTFEQNLRASLDNMYGNHSRALEIWGNLIGRPDVFNPSIRRQMVWTYLARVKRDWAQLSQDEIEKISRLLEDNLHEDPNNERDLRLWIQLVRWLKLTREVSAERVIEKISYWKIQSDSLESTYYLMILHGLLAFQGSPGHREKHNAFKLECKRRAQYFANRTRSYEWLGAGLRLGQLINHSRLEGWDNATQFWTNTELLIRIPGVISKIDSPQAGFLEIGGGLEAFFVPSKANVTRSADENKRVTCFIGFSFDGLRAWEVELV